MLIDGRKIAEEIALEISEEIKDKSIAIKLLVLQVGDDAATESFIRAKRKFADKVGIIVEVKKFPSSTNEAELLSVIASANKDKNISGVIVQLPLPASIDASLILDAIIPAKDPDLLSSASKALFAKGDSLVLPPVVAAVERIVDEYDIDLYFADVAVVGYGKLVGEPVATWLRNAGVEYVVVTSENKDPSKIIRAASVIISGVGKPGLIKPEMVNEDVVIIDAGTSESPDASVGATSALVGDADPACAEKAKLMTPVPGGVGPVAVAMLFTNLVDLSKL